MSKRASIVVLAAVSLLIGLSTLTRAADENRAAVVVAYGDGLVSTQCVSFVEPELTGFELLQRSGLGIVVEDQAAGAVVCRIDGTGCPADDCFCQCRGGADCIYWSYWHLLNNEWAYSAAGSSIYRVADGDVDGWAWGPGSITEAIPPPSLIFEDVCESDNMPTITLTPSVTPTPLVVPGQPVVTETSVSAASPTSRTTGTPTVLASGATPTATLPASSEVGTPVATVMATAPTTSQGAPPLATVQPAAVNEPASAGGDNTQPEVPPTATVSSASATSLPGGYPASAVAVTSSDDATGFPISEVGSASSGEVAGIAIETPNAIAVIGASAAPPETTDATVIEAEVAVENTGSWVPYVALLTMLLGLGALALLARVRVGRRGGQE